MLSKPRSDWGLVAFLLGCKQRRSRNPRRTAWVDTRYLFKAQSPVGSAFEAAYDKSIRIKRNAVERHLGYSLTQGAQAGRWRCPATSPRPRSTTSLRSSDGLEAGTFANFADLRRAFNATDKVGDFYVFDIGGNKFRLVAAVHFNVQKLYVRHVFTHREYDKWKP
jgi:mRNA-degrading endonuclease HigB of HigAB toxin-antitoxin module